MSLRRDSSDRVTEVGGANAVAGVPEHAPEPSAVDAKAEPSVAAGLRHQLTLENALSKLHQAKGQLRELRNTGSVRIQRVMGIASTYLPPTPLGALCGVADTFPLSAESLMLGYAQGIFALDFDGRVRWHCPPERFVVYLSELRVSSDMWRELELERESYDVTFDRAPREVLDACAADRSVGEGAWLSQRFIEIYLQLWEMGAMHSVEAWKDGKLVGGSFGVSIGRVWTTESRFQHDPHAGKLQFTAVAQHLKERGYDAVDGQIYSDHFARFGAREIPIAEYRALLARGLANPVHFYPGGQRPTPAEAAAISNAAEPQANGARRRQS